MKRLIYIVVTCVTALMVGFLGDANALPKDLSKQIVHIDGVRYYVHTVEHGNTLYSLSKTYDTSDALILQANPTLGSEGLQIGMSIKIPVVESGDTAKKLQRKKFDEHIIMEGETLYAISRRYELSVSTILEDNPMLDPTQLTVGSVVNIRKSELGLADESTTKSELNEYRTRLNSVVPAGYKYYMVTEDDTIISIAELSDMSVAHLRSMNKLDVGESVAVGDIILIRDLDYNLHNKEYGEIAFEVQPQLMEPIFSTLSQDDTLKVALMLPLQMRGYNMKPFAEFYHGFLLGVEDLRAEGVNVIVNLYNTLREPTRVAEIIRSKEYAECQLIVGPVYEELLAPVLADAEFRNVPLVSPLVNIEGSDSPVLFQMAPERNNRYDKVGGLLAKDRTVTLIYGESNDTEYENEIKALLDSFEISYEEHQYRYEHTSVISDRVKELEEKIEEIEKDAIGKSQFPDQRLIDSLQLMMVSQSDPRPVVANEADYNTFFIMSNNETEVDRILSSLISAASSGRYSKLVTSSIDSTMMISISVKPSKYEVVANPAWRQYKNIDPTIYFSNRVVNFSSYLAGRESEVIRDFDSRYSQAYNDMPSLYAYRGYDVIKIFGESAYGKIRYGLLNESFTPLQTEYRFEIADSLSTRRVNKNWMRVNYQPNLKFNIE